MPKITLMPEGINAAFAGGNAAPRRRGVVRGLSAGAARRNQKFLMSIDQDRLTGVPVSFTLTVRDVPASSEDWDRAKRALWMRFRRYGVLRLHWVLEWTRRGRPHLHGIAFLPTHSGLPGRWTQSGRRWEVFSPSVLIDWWQEIAAPWGVSSRGQHCRVADHTETAWLRYMAKHASRGVSHYQRQAEAVPPGWRTTGRMWGTIGDDWPIHTESHEFPDWVFHRLRRFVRALTRSRALLHIEKGRRHGNPAQVAQGRATLRYLSRLSQISNPARSATVPISEWVELELSLAMIECIRINCHPPVWPSGRPRPPTGIYPTTTGLRVL